MKLRYVPLFAAVEVVVYLASVALLAGGFVADADGRGAATVIATATQALVSGGGIFALFGATILFLLGAESVRQLLVVRTVLIAHTLIVFTAGAAFILSVTVAAGDQQYPLRALAPDYARALSSMVVSYAVLLLVFGPGSRWLSTKDPGADSPVAEIG